MKNFRFTREVRDLVVTMVVAVAGASATWALASIKTERLEVLGLAMVVAVVLAVAAALLKAWQRPSEDPGKNTAIIEERSNKRSAAKQPKSAPDKSLAP